MNDILKRILNKSLYVHKEIIADEMKSAEWRWQNKKVYESKILYDGTTIDNIVSTANIKLDKEFVKTANSSLKITASTDIENVFPRPWPTIRIKLGKMDLTKYNRISCDIYIRADGYQNFYYQFFVGNKGERDHHSPSLEPNKWNHIIWEIGDVKRDNCEEIIVSPWLMGTPPEGLPNYEIFIDNFTAEIVDEDYILGWKLHNRIAYCHVGYLPNARKIALTEEYQGNYFKIVSNNQIILEKNIEKVESSLGNFIQMDFSEVKIPGMYKLIYGNLSTEEFLIGDCYESSIWKSLNFLRLLRCGEDIPGVHSACHLNCRTLHENGSSVPNFGGWHDAGDVSQFEIPTAEMTNAIVDLALTSDDLMLVERLKEEARVGLNWLLRTRFGDGYRALAIGYSIWRKNVLTIDNKTVYNNKAENGPFENFCSSAALAKAYLLFKDEDEIFANWCKRAAIEDFEFAKKGYEDGIYTLRWGPNIDSQVSGHGIIAACSLYEITKDCKYIDIASEYAKIVLSCQEQSDLGWDIPLKGFFYEDVKHKYILSYEHRGHEQSPVQGLAYLASIAKDHKDYDSWINGLKLYREYVLNTMSLTIPYGLLPGHVYILDKINPVRFTIPKDYGTVEEGVEILKNQIRSGKKLSEGVYLRVFPVAVQRRGFHATMLSKTKGLSMIAKVLNDDKLEQIVIDQLEWVLGKNPFATSTMYGEGHNYHPLYVAFSRQMVGALPVGIMTKDDADLPFWPTRDHAVYKEIWGHTTGKYLWILADLNEIEKRKKDGFK